MGKLLDVKQIGKDLDKATSTRESITYRIEKSNQEMAALIHTELQIQENIAILKNDNIISVASEFKKAKDDLKIIQKRVNLLRIELDNYSKVLENAEKILERTKERYVKALEMQEHNVVQGKFGRK